MAKCLDLLSALVLLCLFALGCAPTIHVYTAMPDDGALMQSAGNIVGVRTKLAEAPGRGVITVEVRPREGDICGQALEKIVGAESLRDALVSGVVDCEPKAWTCDHETFAAHELAHVVGLLGHVDEDDPTTADNLMRPAPKYGAQLTEQQKLRVRAMAVVFKEVCR